jgi:transposase
MSLYAAIDLHSTNSVLAIMDEDGQTVVQHRYPNELPKLLQALERYQPMLSGVAVESTYNWYWLVDGLLDHDYPVRLVHAAATPQYDGLKHGDDVTDALHLAQLMRLGVLPEGFIYPRALRLLRDVLRRRFMLVHEAVKLMLSIQSTYSRLTGLRWSANAVRHLSAPDLQRAFVDPDIAYIVQIQHEHWLMLERDIQKIEQHVIQSPLIDTAQRTRLCSVPGIGPILSLTIQLETGPIERFASTGDYASYARMVESKRFSNGKRKGQGNRKCGNRYLCWAYMEAAHHAVRCNETIGRWHQRKRSRKHPVAAIKAVAHKLARACYGMMKEGTTFDVKRAFA